MTAIRVCSPHLQKQKQKKDDALYVAALLSGEYINGGYPRLAVGLLEPLKDRMGEYWDGLYFLGRAYYDIADYDKAVSALEDATQVAPDSAELLIMLGRTYFAKRDIDKGIANYDSGLALSTGDKKIAYLKEYYGILFAHGQYTKAIVQLNALETAADSIWVRLAYLRIYYVTQGYDKMKVHLDVLAKNTLLTGVDKVEYYSRYVEYALETGDKTLAKRLLDEMVGLDSRSALYQFVNGKYQFQMGLMEEAKKSLENAIEYDLSGEVTENAKSLLAKIQ